MAQLPLSLTPPRAWRFANFVAGPNGRRIANLRHGLARGEWFHLCAPAGAGKSHLAAAVLHEANLAGRRTLFVPGIASAAGLLEGAVADLVVVEDVEQLAGDARAERALFNGMNRWRAGRASVLLTGSGANSFELPDLRSRIGQCARLVIAPLDEAGLAELLDRLAGDFQIVTGRGLSDYLLRHGPRSATALVALFERLARRAQAERRVVSIPLAREELARDGGGTDSRPGP